jgi:drug/metabolite transporter (DMT)-like permease
VKYAVLAVAQIAVGAAAIFARVALTSAPPLAVAAARLLIAALILLAIAAVKRTGSKTADSMLFVVAGVALALHFASWITSLEYTSVAISTLLVSTTPIWTALYDSFVCKRRLSTPAWGALVAGILGLLLIVRFSSGLPPHPGHAPLGAFLALVGAVSIAAYFIVIRHVGHVHGTRAIVTRTYAWAALVLIVASAAARQSPPPITATHAWAGIAAMALISQLLGHTALNAALRWFSASAVALTTLLEPVIAGVLAFLIFGERLGSTALAGAVLVLLAVAVFLREEAALPIASS